jgi:hypothetical protein
MHESLEPASNVTAESAWQPPKEPSPIRSTDNGRQMDESDKQPANAEFSIHLS